MVQMQVVFASDQRFSFACMLGLVPHVQHEALEIKTRVVLCDLAQVERTDSCDRLQQSGVFVVGVVPGHVPGGKHLSHGTY